MNRFAGSTSPAAYLCNFGSTEMFSVFASSLEVLKSTSNEQKKKKLCGKYCDKTIEVIMIAFPTIRAETFLFAQLRDEVGIYQRLMTFL